jgi:nicotinamide mononucleotide transporter PnuC
MRLRVLFLEANLIKNKLFAYFSKTEIFLWSGSVLLIISSFLIFDRENFLAAFASLIGVTSLIFIAKGNYTGQILMLAFCVLYTYISYTFSYYGEMITYFGMSMPMAIIALVAWLRHPSKESRAEVEVNKLGLWEYFVLLILTVVVTLLFYFILRHFNTTNLIPSTVSVSTSFLAVYLTFRRSPYYALGYAANDIVLIVLWIMASVKDTSYISVAVCFIAFLANDIYGFISWNKMKKRQHVS